LNYRRSFTEILKRTNKRHKLLTGKVLEFNSIILLHFPVFFMVYLSRIEIVSKRINSLSMAMNKKIEITSMLHFGLIFFYKKELWTRYEVVNVLRAESSLPLLFFRYMQLT
jgi:hypothetical protein